VKVYTGENIRNVAIVGHGHAGKTSLLVGHAVHRGRNAAAGARGRWLVVTDYDEEEIARKMSIAASAAYVEWGKTKINVIDTPGFNMFVHEARMVLPVVDAAIVVVDGVAGVEVVTQRVWKDCDEYKTPRLIVVNRMDRDRANAERVLESLIGAFGRNVIPIALPIGSEKNLSGVVDLVRMKAYTYELGGNGKGKETEIPAPMRAQVQERTSSWSNCGRGRRQADGEFFEAGTLGEEDLIPALHNAIREDRLFP
jgi:elongation factor G